MINYQRAIQSEWTPYYEPECLIIQKKHYYWSITLSLSFTSIQFWTCVKQTRPAVQTCFLFLFCTFEKSTLTVEDIAWWPVWPGTPGACDATRTLGGLTYEGRHSCSVGRWTNKSIALSTSPRAACGCPKFGGARSEWERESDGCPGTRSPLFVRAGTKKRAHFQKRAKLATQQKVVQENKTKKKSKRRLNAKRPAPTTSERLISLSSFCAGMRPRSAPNANKEHTHSEEHYVDEELTLAQVGFLSFFSIPFPHTRNTPVCSAPDETGYSNQFRAVWFCFPFFLLLCVILIRSKTGQNEPILSHHGVYHRVICWDPNWIIQSNTFFLVEIWILSSSS